VLKKKLARLILQLEKMESVLIAYSGGVDSSLLLRLAKRTLGNNVLAVTADSCVYPKHQLRFARKISAKWGIKHKIIKINKLNNKSFAKNPKCTPLVVIDRSFRPLRFAMPSTICRISLRRRGSPPVNFALEMPKPTAILVR